MKYTKVSFERTYTVGAYQNERIQVEISLDDTDNVQSAIDKAREQVWANHKKNNPQLYQDEPDYPVVVKDKLMTTTHYADGSATAVMNKSMKINGTITPEPTIGKGTIEDQIQAYTSADQLRADWEHTLKGSKKYKAVYDAQMDKLTKVTGV